ncbi:MAG: ATP-binding protein [Cyclobacteriaceae bacterium]|nr:ATP-binding protein [Cyclobacteriaceae bacterium]
MRTDTFEKQQKIITEFCHSDKSNSFKLIYIFGNVSTGKTSILNTIQTELLNNDSSCKIKHATADNITVHFLREFKNGTVNKFLEYYLLYDFILIDEYEFLDRRPKTNELFYYLINRVIAHNKRVLITSANPDGLPKSLRKLSCKMAIMDMDKNKIQRRGIRKNKE